AGVRWGWRRRWARCWVVRCGRVGNGPWVVSVILCTPKKLRTELRMPTSGSYSRTATKASAITAANLGGAVQNSAAIASSTPMPILYLVSSTSWPTTTPPITTATATASTTPHGANAPPPRPRGAAGPAKARQHDENRIFRHPGKYVRCDQAGRDAAHHAAGRHPHVERREVARRRAAARQLAMAHQDDDEERD